MDSFGSIEWIAGASSLLGPAHTDSPSFAVNLVVVRSDGATSVTFHCSSESVTAISTSISNETPDLTILVTELGATRLLLASDIGIDAMRDVRLVLGNADDRVLIPPYDEINNPLFESMPHIEGANVSVNCRFIGGPFGVLPYATAFVDGKRVVAQGVWLPRADITLTVRYDLYLLHRLGDIDFGEAIEGGRIDGSVSQIGMLAGLVGSPEYVEAWRGDQSGARLLCAWIRAMSSSQYASTGEWISRNTKL